ncbi:MAG: hypothetical protein HY788_19705 [Deltaproteobacteria bacterium]|nr:hypothetical protein [Deltaproteobacteria bacterium]
MYKVGISVLAMLCVLCPLMAHSAESSTGEGPNLGPDRTTQAQIEAGLSVDQMIEAGGRMFTTPFNKFDGYGDGPYDASMDPRSFGARPSLQGNGTFLRVNGLDAQTCLECHFITRNSTIPATLGIGGVAGAGGSVIFMPSFVDVAESQPGKFNGRLINPPFLFGSGGVELVAKEMTVRLQQLRAEAFSKPSIRVPLETKGVSFGSIVADGQGGLDTSEVEGMDEDLVVRPFGRKGEFATVRDFDVAAMRFHFGMEPVEEVGEGVDGDGDGVGDEILVGELSVLHIFNTNLPSPVMEGLDMSAMRGLAAFVRIGCAFCHRPFLNSESRSLAYAYPEIDTDPGANVYYESDLSETAGFTLNDNGGILAPLFSDLKRHDMGSQLKESFDLVDDQRNREFITARLWGVRDTAPYLHDGRALTLREAILLHGGEAQNARDEFVSLPVDRADHVIAFLYCLRTPVDNPAVQHENGDRIDRWSVFSE